MHLADLVRLARVEQHALRARRLARVDVRADADVAVLLEREGARRAAVGRGRSDEAVTPASGACGSDGSGGGRNAPGHGSRGSGRGGADGRRGGGAGLGFEGGENETEREERQWKRFFFFVVDVRALPPSFRFS